MAGAMGKQGSRARYCAEAVRPLAPANRIEAPAQRPIGSPAHGRSGGECYARSAVYSSMRGSVSRRCVRTLAGDGRSRAHAGSRGGRVAYRVPSPRLGLSDGGRSEWDITRVRRRARPYRALHRIEQPARGATERCRMRHHQHFYVRAVLEE